MKLTKTQLKQIILEELKEWLPPGGYMDQYSGVPDEEIYRNIYGDIV